MSLGTPRRDSCNLTFPRKHPIIEVVSRQWTPADVESPLLQQGPEDYTYYPFASFIQIRGTLTKSVRIPAANTIMQWRDLLGQQPRRRAATQHDVVSAGVEFFEQTIRLTPRIRSSHEFAVWHDDNRATSAYHLLLYLLAFGLRASYNPSMARIDIPLLQAALTGYEAEKHRIERAIDDIRKRLA
jgi:hypothetical protein